MESGIYKITNIVNGKFYIGSSVNIRKRWISHKCDLNKQRHHNRHLQFSFNKHGFDCFKFEVLEQCSRELLKDTEQKYLDRIDNDKCYNIFKESYAVNGKNHPMYGRTHSKEARLKIKIARSKQVISHSLETKKKISEGNKGKHVDMNHINKMVKARNGTNWNKGLDKENGSILILSWKKTIKINGCRKLSIINKYINGDSIVDLSKLEGLSWDIVKKILTESNITIRTISQQKIIYHERKNRRSS